MSYGATSKAGEIPYQQVMDELGPQVCAKRKLNVMDLFGIEGKNTYELYAGPTSENAKLVAESRETSGFCERCCLSGGREALWSTHHQNKTGPVAWQLSKRRHWPCFPCCSRPGALVKDPQGRLIGSIEDPWSVAVCCGKFNHEIKDDSGKDLYYVQGHCCQLGFCCGCCADFEMNVEHGKEGGAVVGKIKRLQLSLLEMCCPVMRYRVEFPKDATHEQKVLLLSSALMTDTVYLEMQGENSGDASAMF